MKDLNVNIPFKLEEGDLTIREGKALELKEPRVVAISGILDSPLRWLKQRVKELNQKTCNIIVNREKLFINLVINEDDHYATTVNGKLEFHPMFLKFGINTGKELSNIEMAKLIKMNRTAFQSPVVAMELVSQLQTFRAKVDKEIEKSDNNRGDRRILIDQAVKSNLPDTFTLVLPIFKGTEKQTIEVEVNINADDFGCSLISPGANDAIEHMRDAEIDVVLDGIKDVAPEIVIIEQ